MQFQSSALVSSVSDGVKICLWRADGERAVSEPYYSHRASSVCVSLSAFLRSTPLA